ncbi:Probable plastid-lipid-associated protein 4, chloroplastic [Linum grandiflorum]
MALSSPTTTTFATATIFTGDPALHSSLSPATVAAFPLSRRLPFVSTTLHSRNSNNKWRTYVSFLPAFFKSPRKDVNILKAELLQAIALLDRGADASPDDQKIVDQIARKLESANPTKEPLKSDLLNGKWELIYTTSQSILQTQRPKLLRSRTNYQAINADTLRAQNMESWPFFNQVTADLTPLNARKVAVKFDYFKILGLIPVKAPERARGELEITYLDEELRVSRGDKGNLFILKMLDPSYRVPV